MMSTERIDIVIIGGGIQGCATAWNLARQGLSCMLLEKDYIARHASGVNAGGVRRLGRHLAEVPLSQRSWELWRQLDQLLEDDTGFQASRQIKVAENEADMEKLRQRVSSVREIGFEHEQMVDRQQLRRYLPAVSPHCVGGLLVEGDGSAIPYKATSAFARAARRLGARIYEEEAATSISKSAGGWSILTPKRQVECQIVVNCAGTWGDKIAAQLGDADIPLRCAAPMLMITQRMPYFLTGVVGTASRPLSFKQFDNGTVLIGGGYQGFADRDSNYTAVDLHGLSRSAQTASDIFPVMKQARIVRSWAGLEGYMPDQIPVLGAGSQPGVFHAFGFSAHGFQLGPVIGETLSALIQGQPLPYSIEPFRFNRFQGIKE